jgi:hypothetical protein
MYGTIAKVAVPGDTGGFLLILGTFFQVKSSFTAVMTGVSEFIGFLCIKNLPSQCVGRSHIHKHLKPHKSGDALLANDANIHRDSGSETDGQGRELPAPVRPRPTDQAPSHSALRQADFWILATVMLLRTSDV